ncbi:hypothetical protein NCS57_00137500 [Fusarium keratoplasticum]|uniref:Uncharacterized protein n=1 Tax=Fusarium keratoplasticum TaxID=1328300 RepID=A0ACC0RF72_9HYPO|nr:hypothetical protein NCS57_00137500 [Fusarium keratoplasticum]KAI8684707.1 hypothetical protein NCS57_00137500 [Fusarium keratoplasticum]
MKVSASALALAGATLISSASAHSWVEYAYKLARNGTMIGNIGFPRGYVPRDSTNPPFTDSIPQNILPAAGQPAYSGQEVLNKFKLEKNPQHPMLEASAGDYIAIMHLENGHTTLPENQPKKPKNRGTLYFYGTTQPKEQEKLFDVHLVWNKDGTGGDKRGRLIATRNYDDGQCYQPNPGQLSTSRSSELAPLGALPTKELACQSDIKLPDDLKAGDIYTIYWYWDWPDLNAEKINMDATKNGKFPWAGTFMRGEKDPNGFTMDAIARNESYSSVIDIKITGAQADSFVAKDVESLDWVDDQNIYSAGIEAQMRNNYQVDVDGNEGGSAVLPSASAQPTSPAQPSSPVQPSAPGVPSSSAPIGGGDGVATVTVTETVRPPATVTTVYVTVPAESMTTGPAAEPTIDTTKTSTTTILVTRSKTAGNGVVTSVVPNPVVPNPSPSNQASEAVGTPPTAPSSFLTFVTSSPTAGATNVEQPEPEPSTVYETIITHISTKPSATGEDAPAEPAQTVVETLTTHINTPSSTVINSPPQQTIPGGQFRETPLPVSSAAPTKSGPPIPSGFLRRRENWVFGDF